VVVEFSGWLKLPFEPELCTPFKNPHPPAKEWQAGLSDFECGKEGLGEFQWVGLNLQSFRSVFDPISSAH
jgi:hypothetical protein